MTETMMETRQSNQRTGDMSKESFLKNDQDHSEGTLARTIEQQTAKLPSDLFLWSALGCMGASWFFHATGKKEEGNFVGQWVPTLLIFGLYNKLVKLHGSDGERGH